MSLRTIELIPTATPTTVKSHDCSAPAVDLSLVAMATLWTARGTASQITTWAQAKIGDLWFDLPFDYSLGSQVIAADATAPTGARNLHAATKAIALFKHFPFDETRLAFGLIATGNSSTAAGGVQGK